MKKKNLLALAMAAALLLSLTACGASSMKSESAAADRYYNYADEAPAAPVEEELFSDSAVSEKYAESDLPADRKLIRTLSIDAETEELEPLLAALDEKVAALEGYVEEREVYNGSTYSSRRYRNANLTLRIPAEHVDSFVAHMRGISNIVSSGESVEDVTLTYVDTETRLKALETERDRLLELMEQAESMADLLAIEERLTDVRYELESVASQLKSLDNRVTYATVHLYITEVQEYTPVAEKTAWQRITEGFADSLEGIWEGTVDLFVWVLANSPYLALYGGIGAAVVVLLRKRKVSVKKFARKAKKEE